MTLKYYLYISCGGLIILLSYFLIQKPKLIKLSNLRQQEIQTLKELEELRGKIENKDKMNAQLDNMPTSFVDVNGELLAGVVRLAEQSGLIVETAIHLNSDNRMQLKMSGTYGQMLTFFQLLKVQKVNLFIEDYQIKILDDNKLHATFDIIAELPVVDQIITANMSAFEYSDSPFCHAGDQHIPRILNKNILQLYSVSEIRMLGFMQAATGVTALIGLPNGSQEMVRRGDKIGVEKVNIVAIYPGELQGLSASNKKITLKMDDSLS